MKRRDFLKRTGLATTAVAAGAVTVKEISAKSASKLGAPPWTEPDATIEAGNYDTYTVKFYDRRQTFKANNGLSEITAQTLRNRSTQVADNIGSSNTLLKFMAK